MNERHEKLQALRQQLAELEAEERTEELVKPSTLWMLDPNYGPVLVTVKKWEGFSTAWVISDGVPRHVAMGISAWKTAKEAREQWYMKLLSRVAGIETTLLEAQAAAKDYKFKWGLQ